MSDEKPWEEVFYVKMTQRGYAVFWKNTSKMALNRTYFKEWVDAETWAEKNYKKAINEIFEKEVFK